MLICPYAFLVFCTHTNISLTILCVILVPSTRQPQCPTCYRLALMTGQKVDPMPFGMAGFPCYPEKFNEKQARCPGPPHPVNLPQNRPARGAMLDVAPGHFGNRGTDNLPSSGERASSREIRASRPHLEAEKEEPSPSLEARGC